MAPVTVVGGGLAGSAAALALAEAGVPVRLVEKRGALGGRASSYQPPGWDFPVDNCQHVLLRCCTNLLDLYRRLGVADRLVWYDRVPLLSGDGKLGGFGACALPAPGHLAPALVGIPGLSLRDRAALALAFGRMMLAGRHLDRLGDRTFRDWLGPLSTTPRLDRTFWRLMLTSVLNADGDRVSASYGLMFFLDGLMRHPEAFHLGVAQAPLSALHHDAVVRRLAELGAEVRLGETAEVLLDDQRERVVGVRLGHESVPCEQAVVAVRWPALPHAAPGQAEPALEASAIVGVHLWFDEPVVEQPVLGLLDHDVDWIFTFHGGRHLSLVVSDADDWSGLSSAAMVARGLAALRQACGDVPEPTRSAACRERRATFVPGPGVDALRPAARTSTHGLYLAGAWTATGWPSTQEGAVRSGYRAAEEVMAELGRPASIVVPDLPATGLMRWARPAPPRE